MPPKVTFLIPVYNREQYIVAAIESILAQSFTDFELLLLDDGSTDGSVTVMKSYTDPRVRVVCNGENLGIPKTRNRGLALAQGEYFAMLDSDDVALPDRLAKQVAFLDRHPDYALVGSWVVAMDAEGRPLKKIKKVPTTPEQIHARLLFRCCVLQSTIMMRTAVVQRYGYRERYVVCQDVDLFVRLAKHHLLGNLPEPLVRRRVHPGRISRERAQLVKDLNQEIIAAQLDDLGVSYTAQDVERHFFLRRMNKLHFTPDADYLAWAEAWLLTLQAANRRVACYPEDALTQVIGELWRKVCSHASARVGWASWKRFWWSPLSASWVRRRNNLFRLVTLWRNT